MVNLDDAKQENAITHNSKWKNLFWPFTQSINNWCSWKKSAKKCIIWLNKPPNIDKIYLYSKDPYEKNVDFK